MSSTTRPWRRVEAGNEDTFRETLRADDRARAQRTATPSTTTELVGSDVIIPPADVSFEEAAEEFSGDGLIPG
jgi:hypothetical protein